jgi:hypothetical protein
MLKISFRKHGAGFWHLVVDGNTIWNNTVVQYDNRYNVTYSNKNIYSGYEYFRDSDGLIVDFNNVSEAKRACIEKYCEQNKVDVNDKV